jgi:thiamine-monophosphate kinase
VSASTELERIALLRALFEGSDPRVAHGIGDDAAVLRALDEPIVWTIDAQVDGTHFDRRWLTLEDVGWRSFMAAASDLAAMGARPIAALSALTLPSGLSDDDLVSLARGQRAAAARVGAPVVGGNLTRGRELSITTTLLGVASRPVTRRGARPGDGVFVTGPVGLAAVGLRMLRGDGEHDEACVAAWRRPSAHTGLSSVIAAEASAAIDVSDGLARDAAHLAEASGVCITFDAAALCALGGSALSLGARAVGADALALALGGGEDYVVLLTAREETGGAFTRVGRVDAHREGDPRVSVEHPDGRVDHKVVEGFDHFSARPDRGEPGD